MSWPPRSINGSGTWNLDDMKAEATRRAASTPTPPPPDPQEDTMLHVIAEGRGAAIVGPGYWHYSRGPNDTYIWSQLFGPPRQLANAYDYDVLMRTMALEPDDDSILNPANRV